MKKNNYWFTTHWPPRKNEENRWGQGIWLQDKKQKYGKDIEIGDMLIIYETKAGRTEKRKLANDESKILKIPCIKGKQGVIKIAQVTSKLYEYPNKPIEEYTNNTSAWWRFHADVEIKSSSGYLSRIDTNKILIRSGKIGSLNNNFRNFGKGKCGLMKISKEEYDEIFLKYKSNISLNFKKNISSVYQKTKCTFDTVESKEHYELKNYVASDPEKILGEEGLSTIKMEYEFPTNDRADIVMQDKFGRIIGVEIELEVNDNDNEGPIQSIKYRRMLEWIFNRELNDSRSFLVANKISDKIKEKCKRYSIEYFEIKIS
jgi:hypothetical protein